MIPFAVRFKGRDIFSYRTPRSGIVFSPFFEWIKAAIWAGYHPTDFFEDLEGPDQSLVIAAYRTEMQMTAVVEDDARKESERKARQKRHR